MNATEARRVLSAALHRAAAHEKRLRDDRHMKRMNAVFSKIKETADSCKDSVTICVNDSDELDRIVGELGVCGYIVTIDERPGDPVEYTNDGEALPGAPYQVYVISWKEEVKDAQDS